MKLKVKLSDVVGGMRYACAPAVCDVTGTSVVDGVTYGPYLPTAPKNPLFSDPTLANVVADGSATLPPMGNPAFVYDLSGGTGDFSALNEDGTFFDESTIGQ